MVHLMLHLCRGTHVFPKYNTIRMHVIGESKPVVERQHIRVASDVTSSPHCHFATGA